MEKGDPPNRHVAGVLVVTQQTHGELMILQRLDANGVLHSGEQPVAVFNASHRQAQEKIASPLQSLRQSTINQAQDVEDMARSVYVVERRLSRCRSKNGYSLKLHGVCTRERLILSRRNSQSLNAGRGKKPLMQVSSGR